MLFYDMHVHSTYSSDGVSRFEDYVETVEKGIIKGIGFSEHIDFLPECGSYKYMEPGTYLKAVEELRGKGYEFFAGGEIDYVKQAEDEIIEHMKVYNYAFTICSVHMVGINAISNSTYMPSISDRKLRRETIIKYYEELVCGIKAPVFDVIGHIGVYKRYLGKDFHEDKKLINEIGEIENDIALMCAKSDKIVEINTSGLFSPLSATVPDTGFLENYYRYGGRNISVGSDAHTAVHVGRGFKQAHEMLREIGFRYTLLPWDREKPQML